MRKKGHEIWMSRGEQAAKRRGRYGSLAQTTEKRTAVSQSVVHESRWILSWRDEGARVSGRQKLVLREWMQGTLAAETMST